MIMKRFFYYISQNSLKLFLTISVACSMVLLTLIASIGYDPMAAQFGDIFSKRTEIGGDFTCLYFSAKHAVLGDNLYFSDFQTVHFTNEPANNSSVYIYPPLLAAILIPFSLLSLVPSYVVYIFVCVTLFLIVAYVLSGNAVGDKNKMFLVLAGLFFFSPILWFHLQRGQTDILILFLVTLGFLMLRKKSFYSAGYLIGIAVSLKLTPIVFLPYLFFKNKKSFLSSLATVVVLAAVTGFSRMVDFVHVISGAATNLFSSGAQSNSLFGLIYNRLSWHILSMRAAGIIFLICLAILFICYLIVLKSLHNRGKTTALYNNDTECMMTLIEFSLMLLLMILVPKLSWIYNGVYGIFAIATYWFLRERGYVQSRYYIFYDLVIFLILSYPILLPFLQSHMLVFSFRALYFLIIFILLFRTYLKLQKPPSCNTAVGS
jgi:hypothetical protein